MSIGRRIHTHLPSMDLFSISILILINSSFACSVLAGSQYLSNRLHRRRRCCRTKESTTPCAWKALPWTASEVLPSRQMLLRVLIPRALPPVTDRLYEAVVPSRHTCETWIINLNRYLYRYTYILRARENNILISLFTSLWTFVQRQIPSLYLLPFHLCESNSEKVKSKE